MSGKVAALFVDPKGVYAVIAEPKVGETLDKLAAGVWLEREEAERIRRLAAENDMPWVERLLAARLSEGLGHESDTG